MTKGVFRECWAALGGWLGFFESGYLRWSLVIAALSHAAWSKHGWWENVLAIVPSILGFSLGAFAIFLAFGDENFRKVLVVKPKRSGSTDVENAQAASRGVMARIWAAIRWLIWPSRKERVQSVSPFMRFTSVFFYFLMIQTLALLVAVILSAEPLSWVSDQLKSTLAPARTAAWFLGYALFIYAILQCVAAAVAIFRLARKFEESAVLMHEIEEQDESAALARTERSDEIAERTLRVLERFDALSRPKGPR